MITREVILWMIVNDNVVCYFDVNDSRKSRFLLNFLNFIISPLIFLASKKKVIVSSFIRLNLFFLCWFLFIFLFLSLQRAISLLDCLWLLLVYFFMLYMLMVDGLMLNWCDKTLLRRLFIVISCVFTD